MSLPMFLAHEIFYSGLILYIEAQCEDNRIIIDRSVVDVIFAPFFLTKKDS